MSADRSTPCEPDVSERGTSVGNDGSVPGTPGLDGCAERQSRPTTPRSETFGTPSVRRFEIRPIDKTAARVFINEHHRHNEAPTPMQVSFAVGLWRDDELVGVVTAGQPVARALCDGYTLEINRSCLEGEVENGNSRLYGAICRAAKALGYRKVVTYTLHEETGASLRASGFERVADIGTRSWHDSSVSRPRYDANLFGERNNAGNAAKYRWERALVRAEIAA